MNIVMTTNSPGEVASWLRPMVGAFRELAPSAQIRVCLAPCTFATGAEETVVRSIPGVTSVYTPAQTVAWALGGRRPADIPKGERGIVLFLGGDLMYAALLGWRTGWPRVAYTEGRVAWVKGFQRFFVPGEAARQKALRSGVSEERVTVAGDLMLDGLTLRWPRGEGRARLGLGTESTPVVGLFPGSRRHEVIRALPMFLRAAVHMSAWRPGVRFVLALSPFVTPEVLTEALGGEGLHSPAADKLTAALFSSEETRVAAGYPWSPDYRSAWVEWVPGGEGDGAGGETSAVHVLVVRGAPFDLAAASDVVLTIPGSNTAELAGLGVPMVVALSLDMLEELPLEGLPGLVANVPVVGPAIRRRVIERLNRKTAFLAWPNRRAGRMVAPELRKTGLTPREIAQTVVDLLADPEGRRRMAAELRTLMGEPGAARHIAAACLALT